MHQNDRQHPRDSHREKILWASMEQYVLLSDNMSKSTSKSVVKSSCKAACVDFVGPYTLKGKVRSQIGLICLTMIDPGSSCFEIAELPVLEYITPLLKPRNELKQSNATADRTYFDKTSTMISHLENQTWSSRYLCCQNIICNKGSTFRLHF